MKDFEIMPRNALKQSASTSAFDVSSLQIMPRQRRSHELTLRVLCAAERIIRDVGYDNLTIAMVAQEAGVSIGGLYGRFSSRDEIMTAINRQLFQRLDQESVQWAAESNADSETAVTSFVSHLVQFFREHGTLFPAYANSSGVKILSEAANIERTLRERLASVLSRHGEELGGVNVAQFSAIAIHLCLASLLRESCTRVEVAGRSIGWPVLAKELPHVALAYLHSVKAAAHMDVKILG